MGVKEEGAKKWGTMYHGNVTAALPTWQEIKRFPKAIGIGSLIGTFIGALPGPVVRLPSFWPMITPSDFQK